MDTAARDAHHVPGSRSKNPTAAKHGTDVFVLLQLEPIGRIVPSGGEEMDKNMPTALGPFARSRPLRLVVPQNLH